MGSTEEPEVPITGAVFTFGKSKFAENVPSKFWIRQDLIVELSCGDEHTAVVCKSGRLFMFGSNEWGQLGLGHNRTVNKPSCVKSLKADGVALVACGKAHTVVYTRSGKLLAFGSNAEGQLGVGRTPEYSDVPMQLSTKEVIREEVVKLAAGSVHSMALGRKSGQIYIWGSNTDGQLGLGPDTEEMIFTPALLKLPSSLDSSIFITDISCGYYHSAFVTDSGQLYMFGDCEGGKLGLGKEDLDDSPCDEPIKINFPREGEYLDDDDVETTSGSQNLDKIIAVSCGGSHTVAIDESGKAYSFGQSSNGQLGLTTKTLESFEPARIKVSTSAVPKFSHVSCGDNHTALVTNNGQLLTFGDGRHGKLCLDGDTTMTNHYSPMLSMRFRGYRVISVHCGGCHTMVVASPIPGFKDAAAADDDSDAVETDLAADGDRVVEDQQNGSMEDINVTARRKHREAVAGMTPTKVLPPLREKKPILRDGGNRIESMSDPDEIRNVGTDFVKLNGSKDNGEDGEDKRDEGDPGEGERKKIKKKKGWDELSDIASEEEEGKAEDNESPKKRDWKKKVSTKEEPEDIEEDEEGEEEEEEEEYEKEEKGNVDDVKGKKDEEDGAKEDETQSTAPKAFFGKFIRALSGKGKKKNGGEDPSVIVDQENGKASDSDSADEDDETEQDGQRRRRRRRRQADSRERLSGKERSRSETEAHGGGDDDEGSDDDEDEHEDEDDNDNDHEREHIPRPKKSVTFLKSRSDDTRSDAAEDGSNKSSHSPRAMAMDGETAAAAAAAAAPDAATAPEKRSWLSRLTSKGAESGAAAVLPKQEETAAVVKAADKNRPKSRACSIL